MKFHRYTSGGLTGSVCLMYISLTEILVLYHAEMETNGNSGDYAFPVTVNCIFKLMLCWILFEKFCM